MEIALVLGLLVLAIVLFATERLAVDVLTLLLLTALVVTGVLTPREAFAASAATSLLFLVRSSFSPARSKRRVCSRWSVPG